MWDFFILLQLREQVLPEIFYTCLVPEILLLSSKTWEEEPILSRRESKYPNPNLVIYQHLSMLMSCTITTLDKIYQ